jgi:uncharacterized protein (TIGR01777 family)
MQTILITGGTGLVGTALCQDLLRKGYAVIVLTRQQEDENKTDKVAYASWDPQKGYIDEDAFSKADHIIHLAGAGVMDKRWTKSYKQQIIDSRVLSADLLVKYLREQPNKVKTLVSASAIGWYGADRQRNMAFTEDDPPADDFLGQTCQAWEAAAMKAADMLRVVCIRTGIVLTEKGGALASFIKPLKFGIAGIPGSGNQMISWIHLEDLCRIYIQAIENTSMTGSYNAVAPSPETNKKLTLMLANKMRGNFFIPMHAPKAMLKLVLGERAIEILKSTTVSDSRIRKMGFQFLYPTLDSALTEIMKRV